MKTVTRFNRMLGMGRRVEGLFRALKSPLSVGLIAIVLTLALTLPTPSGGIPWGARSPAASGQVSIGSFLLPFGGSIPDSWYPVLSQAEPVIRSIWLRVAKAISHVAQPPASSVVPLESLLETRLKGETTQLIRDWTMSCVMPARRRLLEKASVVDYSDLRPFQGSRLYDVMSGMSGQLGDSESSCGALASAVLSLVEVEVGSLMSSEGASLSEIGSSELGLSLDEVTKLLIMQDVIRASDSQFQPPSAPLPW